MRIIDGTIGRRRLIHEVPAEVVPDPGGNWFFITICCVPRERNQLAHAVVWDAIVETIRLRQQRGNLLVRLLLAMPDHLHGILAFPGRTPMAKVITDFKSWLVRCRRIGWQRDFFDHRLRSWESADDKASYIRQNPVRAGLVISSADWPFAIEGIGGPQEW